MLAAVDKKFKAEDAKPTLADFIRLTQLERELEEEEKPEKMTITWVDPLEEQDTCE